MSSKLLCACDRTSQKLISANLNVLDTVHAPFPAQLEALSDVRDGGLWLNPYRGIPRGPRLSRFDVIYLDEAGRVLACSENFAEVEFQPIHGKVGSAIVLRSHTISSVQIKAGDHFRICEDRKLLAGCKEMGQESQCSNYAMPHHLSSVSPTARKLLSPDVSTGATNTTPEQPNLLARLLLWLVPEKKASDPRRGNRMPAPELVAYYWTGGEPKADKLRDVSASGLYLLTGERWTRGTRIMMTLQTETASANSENFMRIESEVVRWGEDGVACKFVETSSSEKTNEDVVSWVSKHKQANHPPKPKVL